MNVAFRRPMTLDAFLEWEDRQPIRYEFDGVQPIAMTGGTWAHAVIQGNLALALKTRLRGKPCQYIGNDLKIEVAGRIRYPDGFVTRTPGSLRDKIAREPVVIFEVLSDSTAGVDTVVKNQEYAATPSVRRYVVLAQDVMGGTMFERSGEDWVGHVLGADSVLAMPEIDIEVPIAEFYEGLELPPPSTDDRPEG
jgi:Uma2 family endonuclease